MMVAGVGTQVTTHAPGSSWDGSKCLYLLQSWDVCVGVCFGQKTATWTSWQVGELGSRPGYQVGEEVHAGTPMESMERARV